MESAVTKLLRGAIVQTKYAGAEHSVQSQQGRQSRKDVQAHLDHLLYIMGDVLE